MNKVMSRLPFRIVAAPFGEEAEAFTAALKRAGPVLSSNPSVGGLAREIRRLACDAESYRQGGGTKCRA